MFGFIIFVITVIIVLLANSKSSYNTESCRTQTKYQRGDGFDSNTLHNTKINSTTAITSTSVEPFISSDSINIVTPSKISKLNIKTKNKASHNKKIRFSNNVGVRMFDKTTRDVIGDNKTKLNG